MRHHLSIALVVLGAAMIVPQSVEAQGRAGRGGRARATAADSNRARQLDSLRLARAAAAGRQLDSTREARRAMIARRDSGAVRQRAADSLGRGDSTRARLAGARGRGAMARPGDLMGARAALAGLQLSETERARVKTITDQYADEFRALREVNQGGGPPTPEMQAKLQALVDRERADIRAGLSPENQAKFDANVARVKARVGAGRAGARPPRPPA